MKKLFISSLILVALGALVGCDASNISKTNSKPIGDEIVGITSEVEEKVNEDYLSTLDGMKELLTNNGINYEVVNGIWPGNQFDGVESLNYSSTNPDEVVAGLDYSLALNSENNVYGYRLVMHINLTEDQKANGFKVQDSIIPSISKYLMEKDVDYTEVNSKIEKILNAEESDGEERVDNIVKNENGNVVEEFGIDSNFVSYSIIVKTSK